MLLGVVDEMTAKSRLLFNEVQALWPNAVLVQMREGVDILATFQSRLRATNYEYGVLLSTFNEDGAIPVQGWMIERLAHIVVPDWEREWVLHFVLPFGQAHMMTRDLPQVNDSVKIKPLSWDWDTVRYQKESYLGMQNVTVFFLGRPDIFAKSGLNPNVVHVIPPSIRGIYAAHRNIAELCPTQAFMVIDEDNHVFDFPTKLPEVLRHNMIFYARNPYNGLEYGHGGIKIFLRSAFLNTTPVPLDEDMTLWVSKQCGLEVVPQVCSEHRFNTSPFVGWRTAFRECFKLQRAVDQHEDHEALDRLNGWLHFNYSKSDVNVLNGAIQGKVLALVDPEAPINDFVWLANYWLSKEVHCVPEGDH